MSLVLLWIHLILLAVAGLCWAQTPVLPPGPLDGAVGGAVLFRTTIAAAAPLWSISWLSKGVKVITSNQITTTVGKGFKGRVSLDRSTGSLELRALTPSDAGEFTINIIATLDMPPMKGKSDLRVFDPVTGTSISHAAGVLIEGESSANLTCEGSGTITTTEWMKDGKPLSPSNSIQFTADNRSVSINPVRRADGGQYLCRLGNPVSSAAAAYSMTVHYGPSDVVILGAETLEMESDLVLFCSAQSEPPANFTWEENGRSIGHTPVLVRVAADLSSRGAFSCSAWNNVTGVTVSEVHTFFVKDPALSPGAAAGVAVGVVLGVELMAVALYLLITPFQRKSAGSTETSSRECRAPMPSLAEQASGCGEHLYETPMLFKLQDTHRQHTPPEAREPIYENQWPPLPPRIQEVQSVRSSCRTVQ